MLAPFNSEIRKIRSQKKNNFFTEIKEPKGAQQFSIFTRAPLAPFWLLRLLNFRRPVRNYLVFVQLLHMKSKMF